MDPARHTLTREIGSEPGRRGTPHLFLVLVCDCRAGAPMRISLQDVDEVAIGRGGDDPGKALVSQRAQRRIALSVSDGWMSSKHAMLRKVGEEWAVEDAGSKNGTVVNGRSLERKVLVDGDLIEIGHTFLLFREKVAVPAGAPPIVAAADLRPAAAELATLLPSLAAEFSRLEAIARTSIPVVIQGETGTGKEIVASAIHAISARPGPFLPVNCGAFAPSVIQSQLFGHSGGAFTGASEDKIGIIQSAEGGTLFLDEIGDLPPASQPLLLRMLQDGEVLPVGATRPVKVNVRVLAASHRDLWALAGERRFRTDLLARLSGLKLRLPPLRERREDLGLLIGSVLRRTLGSAAESVSFTCEAARALLLYSWPLNVRELEKALQAAVVLASGKPVELQHLPASIGQPLHAVLPSPSLTQAAKEERTPQQTDGSAPPGEMRSADGPRLASAGLGFQHLIVEIGRRHVVRVVVTYAIAVFGGLQGADVIVTRLSLPPSWMTWLVIASLAGLPVAAGLAWIFDWTRTGIVRTRPLDELPPVPVLRAHKRLLAAAIGVLAVLATAGVFWWRHRGP